MKAGQHCRELAELVCEMGDPALPSDAVSEE